MRSLIFIAVLLFSSTALAQCPGGVCRAVKVVKKSVVVKRVTPAIVREKTVTVESTSYGFRHAGERRLWWLRRVR